MTYKRKKNYWQQDIRRREYYKAFLQGILLIGVISYLFYGTFLGAILLSPYLIRYMRSWEEQTIKKRKQEFQLQFKEAMEGLSSALNVGYSVENAMRETLEELQILYKKEELIVREFRYMVHQLDMNLPVETILKEFAKRTQDDKVTTFVEVFSMGKRSGGNMRGIIRNAVCQIGEEIDVRREIDTIMAAKKLEFKVMSVIPFAMICYIKVSFPQFVDVLYGNLLGIAVMTVCLIIYVVSYELGKRIVEVEV
jgi:tight adherence protein B